MKSVTKDLGKIMMTMEGEYNPEREYEILSVVSFEDISYISKKNVPINIPVTNKEYWQFFGSLGNTPKLRKNIEIEYIEVSYDNGEHWKQLIALSEITGPQGIQGIQGPKGEPAVAIENYITVEATLETIDITDILPSVGSADTVYRVSNWDGIQYNETTYSEYGWYDNVYKKLATRQTGIDNEPIINSQNLVKSGGVATQISQLGQKIYLQGNPQFESGTISSGVEIENSKRLRSGFIPVKYIKNISVDSSHSLGIVYYDENQIYQSTQTFYGSISDIAVNGYIRILIKRTDEGDIAPSETTGLVCLYNEFGYSPFDIKKKLIKLENISGSSVSTGKFFYNPTLKVIRYNDGVQNITIPFIDGAVYFYNGELYAWNGTDLVLGFNEDRILSYTTNNNITFESGTLNLGTESANSKRIRSEFVPVQNLVTLSVDNSHSLILVFYDKNKNYLSQTQWISSIDNQDINGYIRIIIKRNDEADIDSAEETGLIFKYFGVSYNESDVNERLIKLASITGEEVATNSFRYNPSMAKLEYKMSNGSYITIPFFDGAIYTFDNNLYVWDGSGLQLVTETGVPGGGTTGQVLTPDGWSGDYPTVQQVNTFLGNYVSDSELQQTLQNYVGANDEIANIADGAVTIPTLSQPVKDYIEASGGGTITNAPDDIDIENDRNHRLQLKGGGVCRFRVKSTAAANYEELIRCLATGLPIQIEDVVDLAHSNGSVRDITFNNDTLVFVGNGQIKNCHIIGSVYIQANKTKIFDNVYFHHWTVNGVSQGNGSSLYGMILVNTNYDVYNRANKTLAATDVSVPVNPFNCSFTANKIGSFVAPVLESGKYVYKEDGNVVLTFDDDGSGNIKLPIRKDFLFLDDGSVAESTYNIKTKTASYTYVAASDLTISRLYAPIKVMDGAINGNVYPEWWGAKAGSSYDSKDAFQNAMIHGGNIELSSDYHVSGGIRIFGNTKISGNMKKITLLATSTAKSMFEIESVSGLVEDGIYIYDLTLDGNKSNQSNVQDGIYCDFRVGIQPFNGYSMNNTYWYNIVVQNFTGSGICVAVPGTSHIYSSWLAYNNVDGITWDNEHFTLTNVTCWGNGRHGAYASGNHWRIIGGAYAHNVAGDNIHCDHAFQSQIIGCSCIDSGKFVVASGGAYAADPSAKMGYSYVGTGNGTHNLVGGNGINMISCTDMTLIGVRINSQNANGILIDGGARITISDSQFTETNLTSNPSFSDINGSAFVSNSHYNGGFVVTNQDFPKYFLNSNNTQNWNNLLETLPIIREGEYKIADYYNAANRPSDAGSYLAGTITCKLGSSNTLYRTYIRLMDENGVLFTRYVNINVSTGAYTNDSGWKTIN